MARQNWDKCRNVTVQITSFSDIRKAPTAHLINAIYKLMYLYFKRRELFLTILANHVYKLVHSYSFVYLICNSLGKYFPYFKLKIDYSLYIIIFVINNNIIIIIYFIIIVIVIIYVKVIIIIVA